MLLGISSVWKLGSRAEGNTAVYREISDKQIFSIWFRNTVIFPHTTIIPFQDFLQGHILFHLDNPGPNPVEKKTISKPNPKNPIIRPDWTPNSGSCTPVHHWCAPVLNMIRFPDRVPTGFCNSKPDPDWTGCWKKTTGSDMDIQTALITAV